MDYDSVKNLVDGLCSMYEQKLKVQHPEKKDILYDVSKLFEYLDSLADLGALLYNVNIKAYEPKGREWVKEQIYRGLKQQSAKN